MALHVDKVQLAGLAKKLAALECAAGFDETVLLYPETEAWAAIISKLCNRCAHMSISTQLAPCQIGATVSATAVCKVVAHSTSWSSRRAQTMVCLLQAQKVST